MGAYQQGSGDSVFLPLWYTPAQETTDSTQLAWNT